MRILYLHQYYKTPSEGGGIRSWHLSRYWASLGHQVCVITTWSGKLRKVVQQDGVKVIYLPINYNNAMGWWQRVKAFNAFVVQSATEATRELPAELLFATSTPLTVGITALWLRWWYHLPYIFEVRDIWPEAPIQLGVVRSKLYAWALRKLEQYIYKNAKAIVGLSPPVVEYLKAKAPGKDIQYLPNMADVEYFATRNNSRPGDAIHIVYTGTLGYANHVEALLKFAAKQTQPLKVTIAGKGAEVEALKQKAKELGLPNVHFAGHQGNKGVRELLAQAHFAWVGFRQEPILQTNSPNKFFDALSAGVPILLDVDGWLQNLVEEQGVGYRVTPSLLLTLDNWASMSQRCQALAYRFDVKTLLPQTKTWFD